MENVSENRPVIPLPEKGGHLCNLLLLFRELSLRPASVDFIQRGPRKNAGQILQSLLRLRMGLKNLLQRKLPRTPDVPAAFSVQQMGKNEKSLFSDGLHILPLLPE